VLLGQSVLLETLPRNVKIIENIGKLTQAKDGEADERSCESRRHRQCWHCYRNSGRDDTDDLFFTLTELCPRGATAERENVKDGSRVCVRQ
jgi:hypothetical protein